LQRPSDRQIHALGERAKGFYEGAAGLDELAADIFRLPQDRSAFAEAMSKESQALFTLG
jgi:hypothetical protein